MRVNFNLNGTNVQISATANERLSTVLRRDFALTSIKTSCSDGISGYSNILMDDKVVSASLIPVFKAEGAKIISLEHFKTTKDYKHISNCFDQCGVKTCSYCDAGKYLAAYSVLNANIESLNSDVEKIVRRFFSGTMCRCTGFEDLLSAIERMLKTKRRK